MRSASSDRAISRSTKMLDIILIAIGVGCFAIAIAYSYACDRL
jgi:hypothetical protein